VQASVWNRCVRQLRSDLSEQQFNTWIRPLQAIEGDASLRLLAPNRFVVDWVNSNCIDRINELVDDGSAPEFAVSLEVGSRQAAASVTPAATIENFVSHNKGPKTAA
jgi:chromosomal replication initiator protein